MRIFKEFPKEMKCVICGTDKEGECTLVALDGTADGGN